MEITSCRKSDTYICIYLLTLDKDRSPVLLASSSSSLAMVPGHSSVLLTPFCHDVSVPDGCLVGMDIDGCWMGAVGKK
ncbi:Cation Channel Sperm-Associated Protein Subunit Gamma [Manis pentadactyla]|nr:Cation Channel Sperm-Associated Protein Subunit Gamma [Manis pentadactyla]